MYKARVYSTIAYNRKTEKRVILRDLGQLKEWIKENITVPGSKVIVQSQQRRCKKGKYCKKRWTRIEVSL